MRITKFSIQNSKFTILVFSIFTVLGLMAYFSMPRTENPETEKPGVTVAIFYPGASTSDLEKLIVDPLEEAFNGLEHIKSVKSIIKENSVITEVQGELSTTTNDVYDDVIGEINKHKDLLPQSRVHVEVMKWKIVEVYVAQYALVSESAPYSKLQRLSEVLEKELETISSVKGVDISGYPTQEVRISLNLEKMKEMGVSFNVISQIVKSNNVNIPGGALKLANKSFNIKTSGTYDNLEQIKNTVVSSYNGRVIYLKNIADVGFAYADHNYITKFNGKKAVYICLKQKAGKNLFFTEEHSNNKIEEFKKSLPDNIKIEPIYEQTNDIKFAIDGFVSNLLQGILLVGIVILLAMGYRNSLIVVIAIPLSLICGILVVNFLGFGIQQMTIAGLIVSLGLLVDNSIVIVENINVHRRNGLKPIEAALAASSEIGNSLISSTVTTLLAFVPLALLPGVTGSYLLSMPLTIIATLTASLLIALALNPILAAKFTPKKVKSSDSKISKYGLKAFASTYYSAFISYCLRRRYLVIAVTFVMFLSSLVLFKQVGVSFFPNAEKPYFLMDINLADGTNIDRTSEIAALVEKDLENYDYVESFATNIGKMNPKIYFNMMWKNQRTNYANIFVRVNEYNPIVFGEFIAKIRQDMKKYSQLGAEVTVIEFKQSPDTGAPVNLTIEGDDTKTLEIIGGQILDIVRKQPNIINAEKDLDKETTNIFVKINRDKANLLGVPIIEIDKSVRVAMGGMTITKFKDEVGDEFNVVMRLPVDKKTRIADFDKVFVLSRNGKQIPLRQLAKIEFSKSLPTINHFNLKRTVTVSADLLAGANLDEVLAPVIKELDSFPFPDGYRYMLKGEKETRGESFGGMQIAMILALLSIFAVLVLQFRSFAKPMIIFSAIPLALIGSTLALFLAGYSFSLMAFVGITSLIGIVINNSIMLVDRTNQLLESGLDITESLRQACVSRFVPIILTTITTVGGLLPLTLRGGNLWAPMGWSIIGGMLVSTLLTLVVVPVLFKTYVKR